MYMKYIIIVRYKISNISQRFTEYLFFMTIKDYIYNLLVQKLTKTAWNNTL